MPGPETLYQAAKRVGKSAQRDHQIDVTGTTATTTLATITAAGLRDSEVLAWQAIGGDCYLLFSNAAGSVTAETGMKIADGTIEEFWWPPQCDRVHVIGSATCKLNVWEASGQ